MKYGSYDELFVSLVDYLKSIGCDKQKHGNGGHRTLLDHLVGVSKMLSEQNCSDALCIAGLFHSIYGTSFFRHKMISMDDRDTIKNLIGVDAENIVYNFCILPRKREDAIGLLEEGQLKNDLYELTRANNKEQKIVRYKRIKMNEDKILQIHDDVVEYHNAELIDSQMRSVSWKFDYPSNKNHQSRHWHIFCGNSGQQIISKGFEWVMPIWTSAMYKYDFKKTYNIDTYERIYMNAHTHGVEPVMHTDDGDFTMIYYPRMDWKPEWGGGTLIDGELVPYVGNRLVVFDAYLPHMAMPVTRECYDLRSVIVFKCNRDV